MPADPDHTTTDASELDLAAYLQRIAYDGPVRADLATLAALQWHHVTHIPFENIDVQLGRPIFLGLAHLQAKLVHAKRGGYCFEHNTLMAAVLKQIGFRVETLAARVRYQATQMTPRTHMLLRVAVGASDYLVDTAFGGGWGPIAPIELRTGVTQTQDLVAFELRREGDVYRLFVRLDQAFTELYEFTLEPHYPVDYELANHFTSTHPSSRFVQTLIVTMPLAGTRYVLRDLEFSVRTANGVVRQTLQGEAQLRELLLERFGLALPPGAELSAMKFAEPRRG
jgi:N-hydroxyarylamine O-acetyltransferase